MIKKSQLKRYIDEVVKREVKRCRFADTLTTDEKNFYRAFLKVKGLPSYVHNAAKRIFTAPTMSERVQALTTVKSQLRNEYESFHDIAAGIALAKLKALTLPFLRHNKVKNEMISWH